MMLIRFVQTAIGLPGCREVKAEREKSDEICGLEWSRVLVEASRGG